ncbi:DUF6878 family protein [Rhizorhabdus dicambivorans]|uniref:DUF6878 domain-containing protein n=1 Tax=Rhizorhabdus dicambivorans TaxID=1850238 RepID=A0A2A4FRM9_9SPHN|nr:DUF6878 family protein [Rhizorhabdus dicambivorans]ATE66789.1 hypothetical protein CMV14_22205 [Rhizorhabdus dicambivorans]PCE40779.1 hypothetical protein COO09_18140 [Rhizorhabdus dicambivorans]
MTTDQPASPEPQFTPVRFDHEAWLIDDAKRRADFVKEMAALKTSLFDTLASHGIVSLTVTFDGCGDSGQIEDIAAFDEHGQVALKGLALPGPDSQPEGIPDAAAPERIEDAIESLAYDLLASEHCGWENNDGAYGEFTFDVATRKITLEHNERFTSSELYTHEW